MEVRGGEFEFWDPLPKFGTGKARDFKFGIRIEQGMSHLMDDKIPQKWGHGVWGRNIEFCDSLPKL